MPKRTTGGARSPVLAKGQQKQGSPSSNINQERAYVAASRRTDRSIDARMQSAHMASETHKKRTGKGLRITQDIVRNEEMYEEEDSSLDSYRQLIPSLTHSENDGPMSRAEAFLSNRLAMSEYLAQANEEWRENEINVRFAQSFPDLKQQASELSPRVISEGLYAQASGFAQLENSMKNPFLEIASSCTDAAGQRRALPRPGRLMSPTKSDAANPKQDGSDMAMDGGFNTSSEMTHGVFMGAEESSESAFTTELPAEASMLLDGLGMEDEYDFTDLDQAWLDQCGIVKPAAG